MIGRVLLLVSEYQKANDMRKDYNKYSKFYKGRVFEKTETVDYMDPNSPLVKYIRRGKALKTLWKSKWNTVMAKLRMNKRNGL